MLWDPGILNIQTLKVTDQIICVQALFHNGKIANFSFVYGSNSHIQRKDLWQDIIDFAGSSLFVPWALLGDFNAILNSQEKVGGADVRPHDLVEFLNCVQEAGIFDCKF